MEKNCCKFEAISIFIVVNVFRAFIFKEKEKHSMERKTKTITSVCMDVLLKFFFLQVHGTIREKIPKRRITKVDICWYFKYRSKVWKKKNTDKKCWRKK